jgi:hypothetical protein
VTTHVDKEDSNENHKHFAAILLLVITAINIAACGKTETMRVSEPPTTADVQAAFATGTSSSVNCKQVASDFFKCTFKLKVGEDGRDIDMDGGFEKLSNGQWRMNMAR